MLITNAAKGVGVAPWVISALPPKIGGFFADEDDGEKLQQWEARREALQAAGVTVIPVEHETIRPSTLPLSVHDAADARQIQIFPQQTPNSPFQQSCACFAIKVSAQSWSRVGLVSFSHFLLSASSMP